MMADGVPAASESRPFAEVLRRARLRAGLTQEQLAEQAGLSARGVSDLERGARSFPRPETLWMLADGLGIMGPERTAFLLAGRRPSKPRQPAARSPAPSPPVPQAPLPIPLDRLIGREEDIIRLLAILRDPQTRFVTLTGPGGSGKTRLALEVGAALREHYPDGVWFVDLAPLRDPSLVVPTIAITLRLRESSDASVHGHLVTMLHEQHLLLLLDNGEHLLAAAPDLVALLAACPHLIILATSREPWRVRGEREVPVAPLPVPAVGEEAHPDALAAVPAVALFVQRAQMVNPHLTLTTDNAPVIAAICRELDGLPLAIELAAARTKLLPPPALLARLEQRLAVLTGGPRDAPARQRTMRDTIAWSHDLLSSTEQTLFRRAAVFTGGFTLEAAEAVAGGPEAPIDVLDGVASLVDKSLLRQDGGDTPRFGMLETVREYALERLSASGEEEAIRTRHAEYFVSLAERAETEFFSSQERAWLDQWAVELGNIRAALDWSMGERGDPIVGLRLGAALWWFWLRRVSVSEGRAWLERGLAQVAKASVAVRAKALAMAGGLANLQADYHQALAWIEESLALYHTIDDPFGLARAQLFLGDCRLDRDEVELATAPLEAALAGFRTLKATAWAGSTLFYLAVAASRRKDDERARALAEEGLRLCGQAGFGTGMAIALVHLGTVAFKEGRYEAAERYFRQALALRLNLADRYGMANQLTDLAYVAEARGQAERAARLEAIASALRRSTGTKVTAAHRADYERLIAALREALGHDRIEAEWAGGQALTPDEAVALAREVSNETV